MIPETPNLELLLNIAVAAARDAGEMVASRSGSAVEVLSKNGGGSRASQVVTEVDLASQEIILRHLKPAMERWDIALLTEESPDDGSRLNKEYFWCVDPLDGTLPFTEGIPGYAVSIALVSRGGRPLIGAVFDPVTGDLYCGVEGRGSLKNGSAFKTGDSASPDVFTWIMDRSLRKHERSEEFRNAVSAFVRDRGCSLEILDRGGAVMNAIRCLDRVPGLYFKPPREEPGGGSLWDYAATSLIVSEAGGFAADYYGEPLDLNRADSSFMNHRGICYCSCGSLREIVLSFPGK